MIQRQRLDPLGLGLKLFVEHRKIPSWAALCHQASDLLEGNIT